MLSLHYHIITPYKLQQSLCDKDTQRDACYEVQE